MNELFDTWHLWTIEYEKDETYADDLQQEDFNEFTERLYKWIQAYKHINKRFIKYCILEFYTKDDVKHVIDELLREYYNLDSKYILYAKPEIQQPFSW